MDIESGKIGLLNKAGKWVVEPQFNKYFRPINQYFYTDQIDNHENTYHFNPTTQKIQKVNYNIDDSEIYNGKYVRIEPHTNGPNGLANALTGEIILPMDYDNVRNQSKKLWHIRKGDQEGALDENLKVILPLGNYGVVIDNGYIFKKKQGYSDRIEAYDAKGKNITNGKYDEIKGSFGDGLLLVVKDNDPRPGYSNSHYYYIDINNNVKIDATAKGYKDCSGFSAGLAIVKNESGDYGYINTKGDLAIPYTFEYARDFYTTSELALVKLQDNTYALINKQGKVVKKLPGTYNQAKRREGDRESRILMSDRKSFNEYGEELEYNSNDYW